MNVSWIFRNASEHPQSGTGGQAGFLAMLKSRIFCGGKKLRTPPIGESEREKLARAFLGGTSAAALMNLSSGGAD
jgi:hypothetical protein